ncbi:MAG TPA: DoxX family protein [Pyrinomonadaceae bacterium]|nr:DoxX family protein [Pyrinomonadaceae bacterium]
MARVYSNALKGRLWDIPEKGESVQLIEIGTHCRRSIFVDGIEIKTLLQTLFFKFTGAKESVYIFTTLGAEPWGRIGSGVVELIASILLLVPRTASLGAILAFGTISGAIFAHVTKLGIKIAAVDDHGELFALAMAVLVGSLIVLYLHRGQIPVVGPRLFSQAT